MAIVACVVSRETFIVMACLSLMFHVKHQPSSLSDWLFDQQFLICLDRLGINSQTAIKNVLKHVQTGIFNLF